MALPEGLFQVSSFLLGGTSRRFFFSRGRDLRAQSESGPGIFSLNIERRERPLPPSVSVFGLWRFPPASPVAQPLTGSHRRSGGVGAAAALLRRKVIKTNTTSVQTLPEGAKEKKVRHEICHDKYALIHVTALHERKGIYP